MTGCPHSADIDHTVFALPLTRADIADYLGLTIETVSRQITRLKSAGTINLHDAHLISVPGHGKSCRGGRPGSAAATSTIDIECSIQCRESPSKILKSDQVYRF